MDGLYTITFLAFIVYNILSGTIYNKDNSLWYYLYCVGLSVMLAILFFVVGRNKGSYTKLLLFIFFIIAGTIIQTWNMVMLQNKKDDDLIADHKTNTNWSTGLFVVAGIVAGSLNSVASDCDGSGEILCSANNIMLFIIANITVYQFINLLKNYNSMGLKKDKTRNENIMLHVGILTLWQIYLYFLADGFRDSTILSSIKDHITRGGATGHKTMYQLFSFISIFVIIAFIVSNEVLIKNCTADKLKGFENTKNSINSITWNMVGTMTTTVIIVFLLSH
jgi:hypothetical protein